MHATDTKDGDWRRRRRHARPVHCYFRYHVRACRLMIIYRQNSSKRMKTSTAATMSSLQKRSYLTVSLIVLIPLTFLGATVLLPLSAYLSNPLAVAAGASDWPVVVAAGGTASAVRAGPAAADDDEDDGGTSGDVPELSVLVGVHTTARKRSRRHLIRMAYALQQTPALRRAARVDVRFVLCARPMPPDLRAFAALEGRAHGDVLMLDCEENAEMGKTYTYFASLPGTTRPYDYVMKVDDDTFLLLDALVETLREAPREDAYCGVGLPFHDRAFPPFMLGMGYLLSWDLVEWIASSDMVRREATGVEDVTTGKWLNVGNKAKNRVNIFPRMYDYKSPKAEDFLENTIGVHQLKEDIRWAHTLEHFNLTRL